MNDLLISMVNILFALLVLIQIYKSYQIKDMKSHSYLWHILTCCGFVILFHEYYIVEGLLFSGITIGFNFITRSVIIMQMYYYNRKSNMVYNYMLVL